MRNFTYIIAGGIFLTVAACAASQTGAVDPAPTSAPAVVAEAPEAGSPADHYQTYCALCHGENREGYKNDSAPSLKTASLFSVSDYPVVLSTAYGRPGTPMGPYLDDMGGPLTMSEIHDLVLWLAAAAGQETFQPSVEMLKPIPGDIELGEDVYDQNCAMCHGPNGEGHGAEGPGTALGNATMLATQPDLFLKNAIVDGREGTPMPAFANMLSEDEIDNVVAFLRSRAGGWDVEEMAYEEPPSLENIIQNPDGPTPSFELSEGRYIDSAQLNAALEAESRIILIDTRVPYFWAMAHIKGSLPVPYYSSRDEFIAAVPNDGTWVVAYCECPRAAADFTVNKLRELGYPNTAVLYEGYAGWTAKGFPISVGKVE
ncbi:MAG: cytochrome c, diheme subunit of cytochrome bc complex peta [Ponticaulis sp.]|nr:cytochrome c, diheme subunit of cytochrome bc complex peta [Ponticaulis sp.]